MLQMIYIKMTNNKLRLTVIAFVTDMYSKQIIINAEFAIKSF